MGYYEDHISAVAKRQAVKMKNGVTEAQQRAKRKYLAKGKRVTVEFYPTEADLIAHLEKQPKKQTYIKNLIRSDILKSK